MDKRAFFVGTLGLGGKVILSTYPCVILGKVLSFSVLVSTSVH